MDPPSDLTTQLTQDTNNNQSIHTTRKNIKKNKIINQQTHTHTHTNKHRIIDQNTHTHTQQSINTQ